MMGTLKELCISECSHTSVNWADVGHSASHQTDVLIFTMNVFDLLPHVDTETLENSKAMTKETE